MPLSNTSRTVAETVPVKLPDLVVVPFPSNSFLASFFPNTFFITFLNIGILGDVLTSVVVSFDVLVVAFEVALEFSDIFIVIISPGL